MIGWLSAILLALGVASLAAPAILTLRERRAARTENVEPTARRP